MKKILHWLNLCMRGCATLTALFVGAGMLTYELFMEGLFSIPLFFCAFFTAIEATWLQKHKRLLEKRSIALMATGFVICTSMYAVYLFFMYHPVAGLLLWVSALYTYYKYPAHFAVRDVIYYLRQTGAQIKH